MHFGLYFGLDCRLEAHLYRSNAHRGRGRGFNVLTDIPTRMKSAGSECWVAVETMGSFVPSTGGESLVVWVRDVGGQSGCSFADAGRSECEKGEGTTPGHQSTNPAWAYRIPVTPT